MHFIIKSCTLIFLISLPKYGRSSSSIEHVSSTNAQTLIGPISDPISNKIDFLTNQTIRTDRNITLLKTKRSSSEFQFISNEGYADASFNLPSQSRNIYSNTNISYSVPIKYLNNFQSIIQTNIPSRVPSDRSTLGRRPSDKPKHEGHQYSDHQFNRKLTDTLNSSRLNEFAKYRKQKLQSEEEHSLSNNISNILEQLLKGYDKNERPNIEGSKTVVTTNIHIRSMGPMSETLMEYSLDCYFRQKWYDQRLKYKGPFKSLTLNIHMLSLIWTPDTFFMNGKGSYVHEITRPNKFLRIFQDGEVYYSMRLTVKARCFMELKNFPMDKQSCPLMFGSYGYQENELKIIWDNNEPVSLANDLVMSQFDLISYPCRNGTRLFRKGYYSMVQVNFNFIRHTGYFLIQIFVPCTLIVVISWVSFWINRENTADRVGLGITSVLTLSTFGLEVSQSGPKVSYPTALNWFLIICFVFANATLIQFSFVHYFTKIGSGELTFYYQQLKTKEKNEKKAKQFKLDKLRERIQYIDQQTKYLKENDLVDGNLTNPNEFSLLSDELTSYDDSNDNLILNNQTSFEEDDINNSELNERDKEIELQMLDIKRILSVVKLNKRKTKYLANNTTGQFNDLQKVEKSKRRSHSIHQPDHRLAPLADDLNHFLVDNLENEEPKFTKFKSGDQPMYCPKHNRWFSTSISTSFDEQTDQVLPDDNIPSVHQQPFGLDDNILFHSNKMLNGVSSAKQWAIDVNQPARFSIVDSDEQRRLKKKKSKLYRDYSLEQQLPFMRWKKVHNENLNPLNALTLNHCNTPYLSNAIHHSSSNCVRDASSSCAFKRQQFKKSENRYSNDSSYEMNPPTKPSLPETEPQSNTTRKRTKLDQQSSKTSKQDSVDLNPELDPLDILESNKPNDKKEYWFENLKLPKLILQFITCVIASEDYRDHILRDVDEEQHINSVSKVDTLSKILFPLAFTLVNVTYWLYYYTERSSGFDPGWKEAEVYQII